MHEAADVGGGRALLARSPLARMPDRALKFALTALAALILALIVYFFVRLVGEAHPAFAREGVFGFAFNNDWNVSAGRFGGLPLLVGTLITSGPLTLIGELGVVQCASSRSACSFASPCHSTLTCPIVTSTGSPANTFAATSCSTP